MSRQSRKRFERLHTKRAKTGFPRVSKAILHKDGTITPALGDAGAPIFSIRDRRFHGILFAGSEAVKVGTGTATVDYEPMGKVKFRNQDILRPVSFWSKLLGRLLWLYHGLRFLLREVLLYPLRAQRNQV